MIQEKPDAIIITFPERFFNDYPEGVIGVRHTLERINQNELHTWGNTIANIPKHDVLWCYICFLGKIQYRMNIVEYQRNVSKEFNDGGIVRVFKNKNWVILTGPVVPAPTEIIRKGFQGFRYTKMLF